MGVISALAIEVSALFARLYFRVCSILWDGPMRWVRLIVTCQPLRLTTGIFELLHIHLMHGHVPSPQGKASNREWRDPMVACSVNLKQYLGDHISKICANDYHRNSDNHCAHFVSHVLGFRFGFKCRNMSGKGESATAANIRVHEIFSRCPDVGEWAKKPTSTTFCLAFVTGASNVDLNAKQMRNHPRKHIGIFHNGMIFHYSNSRDRVVEQTPTAFAKHYSGSDIEVFYGTMPV